MPQATSDALNVVCSHTKGRLTCLPAPGGLRLTSPVAARCDSHKDDRSHGSRYHQTGTCSSAKETHVNMFT